MDKILQKKLEIFALAEVWLTEILAPLLDGGRCCNPVFCGASPVKGPVEIDVSPMKQNAIHGNSCVAKYAHPN